MSFRCRQKMERFGAFPTFDYVHNPDKLGHVVVEKVSNNLKLPPAETTDLKTMLEQGVNLERVNTTVLGSGSFDFSHIQTPSDDEPEQNKGE